ncbi:MAG: amino acid permease [Candidatus Yanofskybacteria bacterium]|nr:amino acid permease [Candidatus Yanofskybacteria bacterium]
MFKETKSFYYATAAMVGTMVGVGVFGVPFSFAKSGFLVGFLFLLLTGFLTLVVNTMFGEVVLRTEKRHQIVGYTDLYLGPAWKKVMFLATVLSIYGAMLAYIIISGDFLSNVLSPFFYLSSTAYSYFFAFILSFLLLTGLRRVSAVEFILTLLFIFIVLLVFGYGINKVDFNNLKNFNPEFWFLPYGILLFAFAGMSSIPIQREILRGAESKLKKSILWAVLLVGILYTIFAFTVVGVAGDVTSPDAITGLFDFLGGKIVVLGSIFGVLAVGTSFLMLGEALKEVFRWDYRLKKGWAWLLVVLPPLALFFIGLRAFIDVISLAGSLAIGLILLVLIFMYMAAKTKGDRKPEYNLSIPKWFLYSMAALFLAGVIYVLFVP